MKQGFVFLKEALACVGIQADILPVSPYKSAADPLPPLGDVPRGARDEMMEWTPSVGVASGRASKPYSTSSSTSWGTSEKR